VNHVRTFLLPVLLLGPAAAARQAPRMTITVNEADLKDILRAATADTDLNLIFAPGLSTRVQGLSLKSMDLQELLEEVLPRMGLACTRQGRNLYIHAGDTGLRFYHMDVLAMSRTGSNSFQVNASGQAMQNGGMAGGSGGSSGAFTSTLQMGQTSDPWGDLENGLMLLVFGKSPERTAATGGSRGYASDGRSLLLQPGSGLVVVGADAATQARVASYLQEYRQRTRRQVVLEARVVEVSLANDSQMGVDWSGLPSSSGHASGSSLSTTASGNPLLSGQGLLTVVATSARVQATLTALAQDNRLKVLSSPRLSTLNNQKAILRVVREEVYSLPSSQITAGAAGASPIATSQINPMIVPVGIVLDILPQIGDDGIITLAVSPSISSVSGLRELTVPATGGQTQATTTSLPVVDRRDLDAVVRVRSGETLVLAGIIQNRESTTNKGVPWLRNIPILGGLFARNEKSRSRTELAIFITPTLLDEPSQVDTARRSTDQRLDQAGAERDPAPPPAGPELRQP